MYIAIRTDASELIGSGHAMRCLVLADYLAALGAKIIFICAGLPGHMADYIAQKGHEVVLISTEGIPPKGAGYSWLEDYINKQYDNLHAAYLAEKWLQDVESSITALCKVIDFNKKKLDLLIIDHYSFDKRWERKIRSFVKRIMVIDDRANRPHDCDLLLDQNLFQDMRSRYQGLVPKTCRMLLGPSFALLRPEFWKARNKLQKRNGTVRRILIFFGGADHTNKTKKTLKAIKLLNRNDISVDVVVGISNPHKLELESICEYMPRTTYYCQIENMAELLTSVDIAICSGGSIVWENCSVGLPSIVLITANNQKLPMETLSEIHLIELVESGKGLKTVIELLEKYINGECTDKYLSMSKLGLVVYDGLGVIRVIEQMFGG